MRILSFVLAASIPMLAQGTVTWEHDMAAAQKRAKKEGKPILVDIWAEWCPPCQHLKNNVFPTPEAQKALRRYVPVSLMTETKNRMEQPAAMAVARNFRVDGYPTLLILDANGKERRRQAGAFATGNDFAAWLGQK